MTDPREYASDLRSAARTVRGSSWPLEMGEWADKLAARLERYATSAPPQEIERPAAHDVIRRLLDGWEPDTPCLGPEVWCWFRGDDDPEPLTPAEVLVLSAVKERN